MDIVAGHTSTVTISGNPDFHGVYFDGKSHYFIDGSTVTTGILPVLIYDTETGKYAELVKDGLLDISEAAKRAGLTVDEMKAML